MAESDSNDLADALARLAGGEIAPSEQKPPVPVEPDTRSPRPAAVKPVSARPAASVIKPPVVEPPIPNATSRPVRPAAPVLSSAPTPPSPGPRAARPVAPALTSALGAPRKDRPSAPTIRQVTIAPTDIEADGGQSTGLTAEAGESEFIDDDDVVIVPAPEASVFSSKSKINSQARAKIARKKNLEFRRTLIPILLTSGVMMLAFASLRYLTGADSTLANLPIWIPLALLIAGAILLVLAVVNMLGVKAQLEAEASQMG